VEDSDGVEGALGVAVSGTAVCGILVQATKRKAKNTRKNSRIPGKETGVGSRLDTVILALKLLDERVYSTGRDAPPPLRRSTRCPENSVYRIYLNEFNGTL
jgi:hypothetical protein